MFGSSRMPGRGSNWRHSGFCCFGTAARPGELICSSHHLHDNDRLKHKTYISLTKFADGSLGLPVKMLRGPPACFALMLKYQEKPIALIRL